MTDFYFDNNKRDAILQTAVSSDGDVVFLHKGKPKTKHTMNFGQFEKLVNSKLKGRAKGRVFNAIQKAYAEDADPDDLDDSIKGFYSQVKEQGDKANVYESNDPLFPCIDTIREKPTCMYITGQTGSGKSYLAKKVVERYHKDYPKNDVCLISQLDKDKTLDELKYIKRLDVEGFHDDPIDFKEFENCLVIFDDFEVYQTTDKKLYQIIIGLMNSLITMGRHRKTSTLILVHNVTNYSATRIVLQEANYLCAYPASCSLRSLNTLLGDYGGLDKKQIKALKQSRSRYVCLHRHYPNFLLTEHSIELI